MTDSARVQALVAEQLGIIKDSDRRAALERLLVPPRQGEREWDYGRPGERYPYWVVAEAREQGIILVYCEHGFGPSSPWGFLFTDEPGVTSLGMDSQWDVYLDEAFITSGLSKGQNRFRNQHPCPCCGFIVFAEEPGSYDLCPVCNWEDDAVQARDPEYRGGANVESLREAREAFRRVVDDSARTYKGYRR